MEKDGEIQTYSALEEYYSASKKWLKSALLAEKEKLYEQAMANALHGLELGLKFALYKKTMRSDKTHHVGGAFAREFRHVVGDETCRRINSVLSQYNIPRYPGEKSIPPEQVKKDVAFIKGFIEKTIPCLFE